MRFDNQTPLEHPDQLVSAISRGEKPYRSFLVGLEHEKFGLTRRDNRRLTYDGSPGIRDLLEELANRFGWLRVSEDQNLIALMRGQEAITLEPGGQFELSGAPLPSLHDTARELLTHADELRVVSRDLGLRWIIAGLHPDSSPETCPWMPKARYAIMRDYMPHKGALGRWMMSCTCTMQVNFDFSSETDMVRKVRAALLVSPFITALFANSPWIGPGGQRQVSRRSAIWNDTDPDRTGIPLFCFDEDFGYRRYVEYALDVPMYFIRRGGRYLPATGVTFRRFLEHGLDGERAIMQDWLDHLTTLFPEVRLKSYIEMRGADACTPSLIMGFAALWKGLIYSNETLEEICRLLGHLKPEELVAMRNVALTDGLSGRWQNINFLHTARHLLHLAAHGLRRQAEEAGLQKDECRYLRSVWRLLETGASPAEQRLARLGPSTDLRSESLDELDFFADLDEIRQILEDVSLTSASL